VTATERDSWRPPVRNGCDGSGRGIGKRSGGEGEESQLSDTALIEQLAIACQKAREGQGNAVALGLLREIAARIGLSGKSL